MRFDYSSLKDKFVSECASIGCGTGGEANTSSTILSRSRYECEQNARECTGMRSRPHFCVLCMVHSFRRRDTSVSLHIWHYFCVCVLELRESTSLFSPFLLSLYLVYKHETPSHYFSLNRHLPDSSVITNMTALRVFPFIGAIVTVAAVVLAIIGVSTTYWFSSLGAHTGKQEATVFSTKDSLLARA